MESITIQKSVLSNLVTEIIFTENDIDLFLLENAKMLRFSPEYFEAKLRFNKVISSLYNIIENEK